ncbi:MAG: tetratricopeptide repeat protein [Methanotrichaceae archaeon]|nr:tetratricopeptide repeat protein [Methanotrichaceae archaeon]
MKYSGGIIIIKLGLSLIVLSILCMPTFGQTTAEEWFSKGNVLGMQGKFDEAIQAYDKAIDLDPNFAKGWKTKGSALFGLGKYDEAIAAYDKAIQLDPNDAEAWNNTGHALESLGKTSEANAAYGKAKELENIEPNEFNSSLNYSYELIDHHVLEKKPPASVEISVKKLAAFLTAPATNDREKARAIYRWITENIEGAPSGTRPDNVLKERKANCYGYAKLFEALAKEANLTAVTIDGHTGITGDKFRFEHTWNAVKINGSWYLLDATGGGEYYFLTPPSKFILDHFPLDPKWQLLNNPLSEDEFKRLPKWHLPS